MPNDVYGEVDNCFIENSLCKECVHRISREIKPLESAIEFWEESLGIEITSETILETHCCIILNMDLDHIVLKCSKFEPEDQKKFVDNINKFRK